MFFRDQRAAVAAAVILTAAAGLAWHDAYDRRGARRPFWTRLAGSVL
jgi:hypothetical protein